MDSRPCQAKANSLVEYILPVTIVGLVLFAAMNTMVPNLKSTIVRSTGSLSQLGAQKDVLVKEWGANPVLKTVKITMDDGTVLEIPEYPTEIAQLLETDGSNGTTLKLLAALDALIAQLEAQGKTDEAASLKALSNQGHRLSGWMDSIERIVEKSKGDKQLLASSQISLGAERYSLTDFARKFELIDSGNEQRGLNHGEDAVHFGTIPPYLIDEFSILKENKGKSQNDFMGREYADFIFAYDSAKSSGALNDSQVRQVVKNLANNIFSVSSSFNNSYLDAATMSNTLTPFQIESKTASRVAHVNSKGICNTGGDQDTGVQCI